MITVNDFLSSFHEVWERELNARKEELEEAFLGDDSWTPMMLSENGIIEQVSESLNPRVPNQVRREWSKVDAMLIGSGSLEASPNFPHELFAIIEHENGPNVEEEMWKLLHWRCPLKVLIFYDWPQESKTTNARETWLDQKLTRLSKMYWSANDFNLESASTNYIFLIGRRTADSFCEWYWATIWEGHPVKLSKLAALDRAFAIAEESESADKQVTTHVRINFECTERIEEHISPHGKLNVLTAEIEDFVVSKALRRGLIVRDVGVNYVPESVDADN